MGRIEASLHKKMVCLEPRLRRRYGKLVYPEGLTVKSLKEKKKNFIKDFIEYVKNGNAEDEEVEYIEDCFDDMERPRFGYMMKIMLKENEPCVFNSTGKYFSLWNSLRNQVSGEYLLNFTAKTRVNTIQSNHALKAS